MRGHSGLRLIAVILLAIMVVSSLTPATSQETDATLPDIDKSGFENPVANAGPGLPLVVGPGETVTLVLKDWALEHGAVVNVSLFKVEYRGGLVKTLYEAGFEQEGSTLTVNVPPSAEPGLYDVLLRFEDGSLMVSARSLWVLTGVGDVLRFLHITDVHFGAGTPGVAIGQDRRFTGYLFSQLAGVDLILDTGDEADTQATSQYINSVAYRYALAYSVPMILNPGNHDYPNSNFVRFYEETSSYVLLGDRVLIAFINTDGERGYPDWSNLTYLESVLEAHRDVPVKIIMMHHPVFYYQGLLETRSDTGEPILGNPHEYRESALSYYWGGNVTAAKYFLKLCEDYNVTLVLAGHIHRDQYVVFHSTRTGTTTLFQTTTTLSHGTGTYQGLQVTEVNTLTGEVSYPLAPPWFVGYENVNRREVYNAIPITMPQYSENWIPSKFDDTYFYGDLVKGGTALIMTLYNNLDYFNIDRTLLLALPWPDGYQVNLKVLDSTSNANAEILDQLRVDDLNRTFVALHLTLPGNSMIKLALYTVDDVEAPVIEFKSTIPRTPAVNKTIKAYINVYDTGWGLASVDANITVTAGEVAGFKFEHYSGDTYLATFKIISPVKTDAIITVTAVDNAGKQAVKQLTISLAGPEPTETTTTTATTGTTETTTQETTTTTTTTTTQEGGKGSIIAAAIIIIIVLAAVAFLLRR